jgi:hypothetical protein
LLFCALTPNFQPHQKPESHRAYLSADAGATAVVSEFRMANRILAAWAAQARRDSRVDFEITFFDGLRLSGGPAPYLVEG